MHTKNENLSSAIESRMKSHTDFNLNLLFQKCMNQCTDSVECSFRYPGDRDHQTLLLFKLLNLNFLTTLSKMKCLYLLAYKAYISM